MKCHPCGRHYVLTASLVLLAACATSWAIRADGPAKELPLTRVDKARQQAPAPAAAPHRAATGAAARREGLALGWRGTRSGIPTRIRGRQLGRRGAFASAHAKTPQAGASPHERAAAVLNNVAKLLRIRDARREFTAHRRDADPLGFEHVRMRQVMNGLPVRGGEMIVHFDRSGAAYEANGHYIPDLTVKTEPVLSPEQAWARARADLARAGRASGQPQGVARLVIFADGIEPCLAYELLLAVATKGAPERWQYWIDAANGDIVHRYNRVTSIAAPTTNGTPATVTGSLLPGEGGAATNVPAWLESSGNYYLRNTNLWWHIYNVGSSGYPDNNTHAYRTTNDWGTSDPTEISAARNFWCIQEYFMQVHGLAGFDNAQTISRANVHEGSSYVNAYWDGTDFHFGDGDGAMANSLAVMDIAGHEVMHAVTEYSAGLVYSYESGALNESFSDIFGACVEFAYEPDGRAAYPGYTPGAADWLCGEDSWLASAALRDLRSPANPATVGAGNEQPSRYLGTYWYDGAGDNGGVHYNSGVQNFLFYLLAEGGTGTNDGTTYSLTGIGITNAEQVAYRALTAYCTPSTGYEEARDAWVSAAADLNTNWIESVVAGWSAIGVSPFKVTPGNGFVSRGPVGGPFTPASQALTLTNNGDGTIPWSLSSSPDWLVVSSAAGSLAAWGGADIDISLDGTVSALPAGIHSGVIVVSNHLEGTTHQLTFDLLVGMPDHFTELFSGSGDENDLANHTLTFVPDESASFYSAHCDPASELPVSGAGSTALTLADDDEIEVFLSDGKLASLYGTAYGSMHVGANGYITFGEGDWDYMESFDGHFWMPRISALFDDLNPNSGGTIWWVQLADRVAVTWEDVPEYATANANTFQVEIFFDGRIAITWLALAATDGLAGLSEGLDVPFGFIESDLTGLPPPRAPG